MSTGDLFPTIDAANVGMVRSPEVTEFMAEVWGDHLMAPLWFQTLRASENIELAANHHE